MCISVKFQHSEMMWMQPRIITGRFIYSISTAARTPRSCCNGSRVNLLQVRCWVSHDRRIQFEKQCYSRCQQMPTCFDNPLEWGFCPSLLLCIPFRSKWNNEFWSTALDVRVNADPYVCTISNWKVGMKAGIAVYEQPPRTVSISQFKRPDWIHWKSIHSIKLYK